MELIIGIIAIVLVICMIAFIILNRRKYVRIRNEIRLTVNNDDNAFPTIQIIEDDNVILLEENKIVNSEDIAILDDFMPNFAMIAGDINNASQMLNSERAFFLC